MPFGRFESDIARGREGYASEQVDIEVERRGGAKGVIWAFNAPFLKGRRCLGWQCISILRKPQ